MQTGLPSEADAPQEETPPRRARRLSSPEMALAFRAYCCGFLLFIIGSLYFLPLLAGNGVGLGLEYAGRYCAAVLLGPFPWAAGFLQSHAYTPEEAALQSALHFASIVMFVAALAFPLVLFYGLAWLYRRRRWTGLAAIGGGLVAACALGVAQDHFSRRVDWTARGLNPERQGFTPEAIKLSGTFSGTVSHPQTGDPAYREGRFEIWMRGENEYWFREWSGRQHRYGSYQRTILALPDFTINQHDSFVGSGHHGRGFSHDSGTDSILPARRLWSDGDFVGGDLGLEASHTNKHERWLSFRQFGQYLVPEQIEFRWGQGMMTLYTIRKIEFDNQPSEEWFRLWQKKYRDRDSTASSELANAPGWSHP